VLPDWIETVDYHTGGEPFRIVADPPLPLPGATVAERRVLAMADPEVEMLRKTLCFEPRGHADMYGCFVVPPDDEGADLGVLFWHKDGFSTACGHGTMALGVWAVENGMVEAPDEGRVDVTVDVPSGRVVARVHREGGQTTAVTFINVPSYVIASDLPVRTSRGDVRVTTAFGGAVYACVDAADLGLSVAPGNLGELIAIGRRIKWDLNASDAARHPQDERLSGIYGTILHESLGTDHDGRLHQRNVTIFADGEVDRSPCGSGTSARVAVLHADGQLGDGQTFRHTSIVGSEFLARVTETGTTAGHASVVPAVTGTAYLTGRHSFRVDPRDSLVPGFVLR
jgi:proline racemase